MAIDSKKPPPAQQPTYGPYLQFLGFENEDAQWLGSILLVASFEHPPLLVFQDGDLQPYSMNPILLDTFGNYRFWRFSIRFQLGPCERPVRYNVGFPPPPLHAQAFTFWLPSAQQPWHWGFHSCSGFSQSAPPSLPCLTLWSTCASAHCLQPCIWGGSEGVDSAKWGGVAPLWYDVLQQHDQQHLHAMMGGGDQVYSDSFIKEPEVVRWLDMKDRESRYKAPFTPDIDFAVSRHMFDLYTSHFASPGMAQALACIPQLMIGDDHDYFDGWGSYPPSLQECPIFQGLFAVTRRFYLLFQHHTTADRAQELNGTFGDRGYGNSFVRQLGREVALVVPDTRAERGKTQIVSPASWKLLFDRTEALPPTIQHIIVCTTVPVLYPKIPMTEEAMTAVSFVGRQKVIDKQLEAMGLWSKMGLMSQFKEVELLDDALDHWGAAVHVKERRMLVETLQAVAQRKAARVSFMSGDVHAAALGQFYSHPKMKDLSQDFRYMPQVVSSAIVNAPPPDGLVKALHLMNFAERGDVNPQTRTKMVRLFKQQYPKFEKILPRRNWAEVKLKPPSGQYNRSELLVTLRVEGTPGQGAASIQPFEIHIAPLNLQAQSGILASMLSTSGPKVMDKLSGSFGRLNPFGRASSHPPQNPPNEPPATQIGQDPNRPPPAAAFEYSPASGQLQPAVLQSSPSYPPQHPTYPPEHPGGYPPQQHGGNPFAAQDHGPPSSTGRPSQEHGASQPWQGPAGPESQHTGFHQPQAPYQETPTQQYNSQSSWHGQPGQGPYGSDGQYGQPASSYGAPGTSQQGGSGQYGHSGSFGHQGSAGPGQQPGGQYGQPGQYGSGHLPDQQGPQQNWTAGPGNGSFGGHQNHSFGGSQGQDQQPWQPQQYGGPQQQYSSSQSLPGRGIPPEGEVYGAPYGPQQHHDQGPGGQSWMGQQQPQPQQPQSSLWSPSYGGHDGSGPAAA